MQAADLNRRVRDLGTTIRELVSPLTPALLQIIGISHNSAAVLIAEIGDITRFPTAAKLTRYAGCAPIPVYSADKERHRLAVTSYLMGVSAMPDTVRARLTTPWRSLVHNAL